MRPVPVVVALILVGCARETPAPEPAPPGAQPQFQVAIDGTVRHRLGPAGSAAVTASLGDASCNPLDVLARTVADTEGRYQLAIDQGLDPGAERCIVVEATAAGARGQSVKRLVPVPASAPQRLTVDIELEHPPPLTRSDADTLVTALTAAINYNDQHAIGTLAPYLLLSDPDALRSGLEHLRIALGGTVTASTLVRERHDPPDVTDFEYELTGSNGAKTRFLVQQTARRMASNALLYYASAATRYVSRFARLVAARDAPGLARLLTADDLDYPVERARALLDRYAELRDLRSAQTVFTGIDETRHILRYRIEGRRGDGTAVSVPVELRYGDGLLGLIE